VGWACLIDNSGMVPSVEKASKAISQLMPSQSLYASKKTCNT